MVRRMLVSAVGLLLATVLCIPGYAQTIVSGDVQGTITDPSGAIVPNTTVTLRNDNTGETYNATTSSTGAYRFTLLRPGSYTMAVNANGFQPITRKVSV